METKEDSTTFSSNLLKGSISIDIGTVILFVTHLLNIMLGFVTQLFITAVLAWAFLGLGIALFIQAAHDIKSEYDYQDFVYYTKINGTIVLIFGLIFLGLHLLWINYSWPFSDSLLRSVFFSVSISVFLFTGVCFFLMAFLHRRLRYDKLIHVSAKLRGKPPTNRPGWKILIGVPVVAILILSLLLLGLRPDCFMRYPGRFVYQETRYVDNPAEASALEAVETFNYTLIPTHTLWHQRDIYINQTRLTHIAYQALTFNPFLSCGSDIYNYTAQVTYQSAVNVSLNPVPDQYYFWGDPSYNITTGTTLLYPKYYSDQFIWEWSAGYKNGSTYQNILQPLNLTYINVYIVDIEFWHIYNHGGLAAATELEQQQAIVDETGILLFVFWNAGHVGAIS